jgi:hypothetical protein
MVISIGVAASMYQSNPWYNWCIGGATHTRTEVFSFRLLPICEVLQPSVELLGEMSPLGSVQIDMHVVARSTIFVHDWFQMAPCRLDAEGTDNR